MLQNTFTIIDLKKDMVHKIPLRVVNHSWPAAQDVYLERVSFPLNMFIRAAPSETMPSGHARIPKAQIRPRGCQNHCKLQTGSVERKSPDETLRMRRMIWILTIYTCSKAIICQTYMQLIIWAVVWEKVLYDNSDH